jgi:hypothetical protein
MRTLDVRDILASASHANRLLARHPVRWPAIALLFLVIVQGLMFVPYGGFLLKLAAAGLLGTQVLRMVAASERGIAPGPLDMFQAFRLPLSSQLPILLASLLGFAVGILFLVLCGQGDAARALFFGRVLTAPRLDPALFLAFKCVMIATDLPLAFIAPAVALAAVTGLRAVTVGLSAARGNLVVLAVSVVLSVAFELAMASLPNVAPPVGSIMSLVLVFAYVTWLFTFSFALAVRIFEPAPAREEVRA